MSKIKLPKTSGLDTLRINDNFQKIEDELNEKVLYRDNPPGEPNEMHNDLDMNGKRIYNLPKPGSESEPLRRKDVLDAISATEAARAAADRAERMEEEFQEFLLSSGYQDLGDYEAGLEISARNQRFRKDGEFYRASANLVLPYTTTGNWNDEGGLFVSVGDAALRQELANPDKGAAMVARGVVAVNSIADLLALPEEQRKEGLRYLVKGYYAGSDEGGGEFYWDENAEKSQANGGTIIDQDGLGGFNGTVETRDALLSAQGTGIGNGCFVRILSENQTVSPEMFGAAGDGVEDDAASIHKWWLCDHGLLGAHRKYRVQKSYDNLKRLNKSRFVDMRGGLITVDVPTFYLLRSYFEEGGLDFTFIGGVIDGGFNLGRGIQVDGDSVRCRNITVSGVSVKDILGKREVTISSSSAIMVATEAENIVVENCVIKNLTRDFANPGTSNTAGIGISNVTGNVTIRGNVIEGVYSIEGDVDADGIYVFSKERLNEGVFQDVNILITENTLKECKGRFIKLQTTGATITHNRFENRNIDLPLSFRGIDSQFGSVTIENNYVHIGENVTGGLEFILFQIQVKSQGNEEIFTSVRNNNIRMDRNVREFLKVVVDGGSAFVDIKDNFAHSFNEFSFETRMVSLDFPELPAFNDIGKVHITLEGNTLPMRTACAVLMVGEVFHNNPDVSNKFSFVIRNNINNKKGNIYATPVIEVASNISRVPYLQDIILNSNNLAGEGGFSYLSAKGMDVDKLPAGNLFAFRTDGTSLGGLIGAPSGFNKDVIVNKTNGTSTELTYVNGRRAIKVTSAAGWFRYADPVQI